MPSPCPQSPQGSAGRYATSVVSGWKPNRINWLQFYHHRRLAFGKGPPGTAGGPHFLTSYSFTGTAAWEAATGGTTLGVAVTSATGGGTGGRTSGSRLGRLDLRGLTAKAASRSLFGP